MNTQYPYTVRAVAQYLGVTRQHVHNLIKKKKIAHIRVGKAIRISQKAIDDYERKNFNGLQRKGRVDPF